jgi:hypothetical protein
MLGLSLAAPDPDQTSPSFENRLGRDLRGRADWSATHQKLIFFCSGLSLAIFRPF